ncbi:MAG: Na+/H+ antiporter subunit E [Solirubrobacteraceae bacterium]
MVTRLLALGTWSFAVWLVLTWMFTLEQLAVGAAVALVVAVAVAPLGPAARPWLLADPRRLAALLRLGVSILGRMIVANLRLTRRIWTPSRPVRSGMVIVPTAMTTDGGLAAVGLITSLIVDNQLVDIDRGAGLLQYHAIDVPDGGPNERRAAINGPIEDLLGPIAGRD